MELRTPGMLLLLFKEEAVSAGFVHFFQVCGATAAAQIPEAFLRQGLGLRLYTDVDTLLRALSRWHALVGPQLVVLAASPAHNFQVAEAVRQLDSSVAVVALVSSMDDATLQQAMSAGIDACWHSLAPLQQITDAVKRLLGRYAAGARHDTLQSRHGEHWKLVSRGWVLQAPEGACLPLTTAERALMLCLYKAPGHRGNHQELIRAIEATAEEGKTRDEPPEAGRSYAGPAARRLSVVVSRLRRKCAEAGMPMPIRSLRRMGYELCIELSVQALPDTVAGRTTTILSRCMSSGSVI